jgi:hypothetical protein
LGYEPNELPDCSTPHLDSNNRSAQGQTTQSPAFAIVAASIRAVSQLRWPDKYGEVWFSWEENHEEAYRFPDFLQRGTSWEK